MPNEPLKQADVPWRVLQISFETPRLDDPGFSVDQWAGVVLGLEEQLRGAGVELAPAVRLAARVARERAATAAELLPARGDSDEVARRSASLLAICTHAALRGLPSGFERDMLQLVEADLLSPPPPYPFGAAVMGWRETALGSQDALAHPKLAVAFAERQWQLLRELEHGLRLVEAPDSAAVPLDRVSIRVKAAVAAWEAAGDQLRDLPATVPLDLVQAKAFKAANQQLTDAAAISFSGVPAADLHTLLQLVPEANQAAAAVLARFHPQCREVADTARALTATSTVLLENGDWTQVQLRPPSTPRTVALTVAAPAAPAPRPVPLPLPVDDREIFDVETAIPTAEESVELARRRDVGVIAQAALDGIPVAVEMTSGTTSDELGQLASDGRRATAQLVVGARGIAVVHSQRVPSAYRDDDLQRRMIELHRAAVRWDPTKAAWSTFAWATVQHPPPTPASDRRSVALVGEADMMDHIGRPLLAEVSSPEDRLVQAETLATIHSAIAALHPDERDVVEGILLRERTRVQLHHDLGIAESTVRRRYRSGLDQIRARLRHLDHVPEQSPPPPHPLAETAHVPRPDQAPPPGRRMVTDREIH